MPRKPRARTLMGSQHDKGSETLLNLLGSIFAVFSDHYEKKSAQKVLS